MSADKPDLADRIAKALEGAGCLDNFDSDAESQAAAIIREYTAPLVEALRDLFDEQNGPPLAGKEREANWEAAMNKARTALSAERAKE